MPRQRDPGAEEDMMARCPVCKGNGHIYDFAQEAETDCPLCEGTGRVTPALHHQHANQPTNPPTSP